MIFIINRSPKDADLSCGRAFDFKGFKSNPSKGTRGHQGVNNAIIMIDDAPQDA